MWRKSVQTPTVAVVAVAGLLTLVTTGVVAADSGWEMRVESSVYHDDDQQPLSRSLALFTSDVVWDFLELPDADGTMQLAEIVLHDPLRERNVLVDPRRGVKVEVDKLKLDRLRVSLASWARGADDAVIRWAASSRVAEGIHQEHEDQSTLVLVGPKVRYLVQYEEAAEPEAAQSYQQFADVSLLLKALVHPGGLPPFPRMAINGRLAAEHAIPKEVRLTIAGDLSLPGVVGEDVLRSEHRTHPRLLSEDRRRISEASARVGEATLVTLEAYANPTAQATAVATEPAVAGSITR